MKKNISLQFNSRIFLLGMFLFSLHFIAITQSTDSLALKYALYRKKLNTVFVYVPWGTDGIGPLVKDANGYDVFPPFFEYSGYSFPVTTYNLNRNELESGDGTIMLGHYIAFLASEIAVLKTQHQDIAKPLEELYLALQTYKRLDMLANIMFEKILNDVISVKKLKHLDKAKAAVRKDGYSAFFLRDDVRWSNNIYKESSWATGFTDITNDYAKDKNLGNTAFLTGNSHVVSQDQVYGLLFGLGFVNALLDEKNLEEKKLKDEARKIASSLIIASFSKLKLPGTNINVARGHNNAPFRWQLRNIAKKWGLDDAVITYKQKCFLQKMSNYFLHGTGYNWLGVADDWTEFRKAKLLKCKGDYRDISSMKLRLECLDSDNPVTFFRFAYKNQKPAFGLIQEMMRPDFLQHPDHFISTRKKYQKYRIKAATELYNMLQIAPMDGSRFNGKNLNEKWNVDNIFSNYEPKACGNRNANLMYNNIDYMLLYNIMQLTCKDIIPELNNSTPFMAYTDQVTPILQKQMDQIFEVNTSETSANIRDANTIELETKAINMMYDWTVTGGTYVHPSGDLRKVIITPSEQQVIVTLKIERCDSWSNNGCIKKTFISNQTKTFLQKNSGFKN